MVAMLIAYKKNLHRVPGKFSLIVTIILVIYQLCLVLIYNLNTELCINNFSVQNTQAPLQ